LSVAVGKNVLFIQKKFSEYYRKHGDSVVAPKNLTQREFGFLTLKERVMVRHKGFPDFQDLIRFIQLTNPSDCYYSSAYYERPTEDMERKGWLGADLCFDIDADHIPTDCKRDHDRWTCLDCQSVGKGTSPENCPSCGSQRFKEEPWFCERCLEAAKGETLKLIDILGEDLGFSPQEIQVYFSGHRGYHVHVESPSVKDLDQMARKEIVDYVLGMGLKPMYHGLKGESGPRLEEGGWRTRLMKGVYETLLTASDGTLAELGLRRNIADTLVKYKDELLKTWWEGNPWGMVKGMGFKAWEKLCLKAVERQSALVDTVVTTDVHRLIRLGGTLHGKTGLSKTSVAPWGLEGFDPLKASIAFTNGTVRLHIEYAYPFRLGDVHYGPYTDEDEELPTAAAMLLLCKGVATLS